MDAWCARHENLHLVCALLDQHDVEYFTVPDVGAQTTRVGLTPTDWARLIELLRTPSSLDARLYATIEVRDRRGRVGSWSAPVRDPRIRSALGSQSRLILFEVRAENEHGPIYGRGQGVHVERWEQHDTGALESSRRNTRTQLISPERQERTHVSVAGTQVTTFTSLTTPHVFDVDFDVDLVYLWVDDSDPQWRTRRNDALRKAGRPAENPAPTASGHSSERFRDYGELRFALRSAHRFAPWARHIYLVTDRQVPHWLDTSHPDITVVDHQDIFNEPSHLPTFNSHSIGSRLHHIDGLSDQYLYINDDVFFGRPVSPAQFFHANGIAKFFMSKSTLPLASAGDGPPHENARRNVVRLLEERYGRTATQTFFHTPVAQRRAIFLEMETEFPEVFEQNLTSRFRSDDDYEPNQWLHHYYGFMTGKAMPGSIRYDYFDLSDPTVPDRLSRLLWMRDRDCFCINDNAEATAENQAFIVDWMAKYFPDPSPFEK